MTPDKKKYNEITKQVQKLTEQINNIQDECIKNNSPWNEFVNKTRQLKEEQFELYRDLRLLENPAYEIAKKWNGTLLPIQKFVESSENGLINDLTATFYYATKKDKTNIRIFPSDVIAHKIRNDFEYVLRFENKDA